MHKKRLIYLETTRGIASIVVVFHHFILGFFPLLKESVTHGGLKYTPLYPLINGKGAVAFFFVLSGFVLTRKYYQKFSVTDLISSVIKRLPRLWLPVGLSMLIGAAVLIYTPELHIAAARLTHSDWLAGFAFEGLPQYQFFPIFSDAAQNSLFVFLEPGYSYYNSNLWTMVWEFRGSLLVFLLVYIINIIFTKKNYLVIIIHLLLSIMCITLKEFNFYIPFLTGSLIAFIHTRKSDIFLLSRQLVNILVIITIFLFSTDKWILVTTASTIAIILLLSVPSLEQRLSNTIGLFLGRLSFPLYLVHTPVILSVTCFAYTSLFGMGLPIWAVLLLCFILTWGVSLLAAWPFMALEKIWVPTINRWSHSLVKNLVRCRNPSTENETAHLCHAHDLALAPVASRPAGASPAPDAPSDAP